MPKKLKLPELPKLPIPRRRSSKLPEMPKPPKPPTDKESLEERWRVWQAQPDRPGTASILEFITWEFLEVKKKLRPDIDFIFQYPLMGGRTQFGGFVADFYFPFRREVWNPAGLHFHWTETQNRARDILAEAVLAERGIKIIYLWEDDLLNRPDYTLEQAWRGNQIPGRI